MFHKRSISSRSTTTKGFRPPNASFDYWDAQEWSSGRRMDTEPVGELLFSRFPRALAPPGAFQARRIGHALAAIVFGLMEAGSTRLLVPRNDQPNS